MMISCCWTPPPWRRCSWWSGWKVTQPEMMHIILNLQLCKTTHLSRKKANSRLTIVFWLPTSATLQVNTINCKHSFLSLKTLPKNDPRKIICMWTSFSVLALEMHKYKGFQFSQMMHFVWVLIQLEISRFWNLPQKERKHLQFKLPRSSPVNFWFVRNERNPDDKVTRVGILEKYVGLQSYLQ